MLSLRRGFAIRLLALAASRSGTTTHGVVGESVTTTVLFPAVHRPPMSGFRSFGFAAPDRGLLAAASPRPALDGPLVLVVDDDEAILSTVQQILTFEGYRTLLARDGAEALELLDVEKPELVLLDMRMPKIDGWEFAAAMRARQLATPIVVMTAAQDARRWAAEVQAQAFVEKPFDLDKLLDTLHRVLSSE